MSTCGGLCACGSCGSSCVCGTCSDLEKSTTVTLIEGFAPVNKSTEGSEKSSGAEGGQGCSCGSSCSCKPCKC